MVSSTGKQIILIHILPNISRSKDNQTMKFGQLIVYSTKIFIFKNHAENDAKRLVLDLFLFFKKALHKLKASGQHFSFDITTYFGSTLLGQTT